MPQQAAATFSSATTVTAIALDALHGRKTRAGFEYWLTLRGAKRYPSRAELEPRQIAKLLSHMVLIKVLDGDFQFRIVGDHASQGYSTSLNDRRLSDLAREHPRPAENWRTICEQIIATGMPMAVHVTVGRDAPEANFTEAEAVFAPLGRDGRVEHIVSFVEHQAAV